MFPDIFRNVSRRTPLSSLPYSNFFTLFLLYDCSVERLKSNVPMFFPELQDGVHFIVDQLRATGKDNGVRYSCVRCNKRYKNKHHLKRHVFFECGQQKKFQCPTCNKCMTRKETLLIHMHTMHNIAENGVQLAL